MILGLIQESPLATVWIVRDSDTGENLYEGMYEKAEQFKRAFENRSIVLEQWTICMGDGTPITVDDTIRFWTATGKSMYEMSYALDEKIHEE